MSDSPNEHHVKQKDMAWWKPVVHQAAEHIDCDVCQENIEGIAQEMQEVIDGER